MVSRTISFLACVAVLGSALFVAGCAKPSAAATCCLRSAGVRRGLRQRPDGQPELRRLRDDLRQRDSSCQAGKCTLLVAGFVSCGGVLRDVGRHPLRRSCRRSAPTATSATATAVRSTCTLGQTKCSDGACSSPHRLGQLRHAAAPSAPAARPASAAPAAAAAPARSCAAAAASTVDDHHQLRQLRQRVRHGSDLHQRQLHRRRTGTRRHHRHRRDRDRHAAAAAPARAAAAPGPAAAAPAAAAPARAAAAPAPAAAAPARAASTGTGGTSSARDSSRLLQDRGLERHQRRLARLRLDRHRQHRRGQHHQRHPAGLHGRFQGRWPVRGQRDRLQRLQRGRAAWAST